MLSFGSNSCMSNQLILLTLAASSPFTQKLRMISFSDVDSIRFRTFQNVYFATKINKIGKKESSIF